MKRRLGLAAIVTCSAAVVVFLTTRTRSDALESAASPETNGAAIRVDETLRVPETRVEAEVTPPKTERDVLREFWGESWAEIEARLEASGRNLDTVAVFTPWEEAKALLEPHACLPGGTREALFDNRVQWPDELTHASLRSALGMKLPENLSDEDIGRIALAAEPFNVDLRAKAEAYVTGLDSVLRDQWRRDRFQRSPFTTDGLAPPHPLPFYSTSAAGGGWSVVLSITKEEHPEFAALDAEIKHLKGARRDAVREYLARR
ncbi:MAG: hypothetical protein IT454_10085 [Planctomycetes bacterium]|nr:hypothetical protein [Planctomycetota bacterium]